MKPVLSAIGYIHLYSKFILSVALTDNCFLSSHFHISCIAESFGHIEAIQRTNSTLLKTSITCVLNTDVQTSWGLNQSNHQDYSGHLASSERQCWVTSFCQGQVVYQLNKPRLNCRSQQVSQPVEVGLLSGFRGVLDPYQQVRLRDHLAFQLNTSLTSFIRFSYSDITYRYIHANLLTTIV